MSKSMKRCMSQLRKKVSSHFLYLFVLFRPSEDWKICPSTMVKVDLFTQLNKSNANLSHEIKRCLLLGRKAMTNLDIILKSRDITLLTKACLVKAVVFSAVMYGCESWTIKRAEH